MKVPYRYRGLGLLALLFLLLPAAAWRFTLRESFTAWRDCRNLTERLEAPAVGGPALQASVDGRELIRSGVLLDTLAHCPAMEFVRIAGYEPVVTQQAEGMALHTARLTLTGDFKSLLRAVETLEHALPACRLRSASWQATTDRRTRRTRLTLTLLIQQLVTEEP